MAGSWSDGMSLVDLLGKLFGSDEQSHPFIGRTILFGACFLFPWVQGDRPCNGDLNQKNRRRGEEAAVPPKVGRVPDRQEIG